jgi:hypothetical protein
MNPFDDEDCVLLESASTLQGKKNEEMDAQIPAIKEDNANLCKTVGVMGEEMKKQAMSAKEENNKLSENIPKVVQYETEIRFNNLIQRVLKLDTKIDVVEQEMVKQATTSKEENAKLQEEVKALKEDNLILRAKNVVMFEEMAKRIQACEAEKNGFSERVFRVEKDNGKLWRKVEAMEEEMREQTQASREEVKAFKGDNDKLRGRMEIMPHHMTMEMDVVKKENAELQTQVQQLEQSLGEDQKS